MHALVPTARLAAPLPAVPAAAQPGNPVFAYMARLGSPLSRTTMLDALSRLASLCSNGQITDPFMVPWWALDYARTSAVRAVLAERYEPATVAKYLSALRGVLKECWRLGLMGVEEMHRATDLSAPRGSKEPAGRHVMHQEMAALFAAAAAQEGPLGARNQALLAAVFGGGLRRAEVVALELRDFSTDAGTLRVRKGKGRKERTVHLPDRAVQLIAAWLAVRGDGPGRLFVPVRRGGRVATSTLRTRFDRTGRRRRVRVSAALTEQALYNTLAGLVARAGIQALSPHDARRTWIGNLLDAGVDISTVQQMAGHASVQTTGRYDRRGERARKLAASTVTIPG